MEEVKGYDISEQLDHIAYMFNVRTKGKKYENFIVNAIYTKVGNPDLMPVTQQYVRNPNDSRKYYLLDLYFPQINFGVEIDEGQYMSEEHQASDKERAEAESAKSVLKEMDKIYEKMEDVMKKAKQILEINSDKVIILILINITKHHQLFRHN